jgi:hypothetical protein
MYNSTGHSLNQLAVALFDFGQPCEREAAINNPQSRRLLLLDFN